MIRAVKWCAAWAVCALALAMAGCHADPIASTYTTLDVVEKGDALAMQQFPALDKAKRAAIVAAATSETDGVQKLAAWDSTSDKLAKAILGIDASVKLARDAVVEIEQGKRDKAEISTWIAAALTLAADLPQLLKATGLDMTIQQAVAMDQLQQDLADLEHGIAVLKERSPRRLATELRARVARAVK